MTSVTTTDGISTTLGQYSGITASTIESLLQADSSYVARTKAQTQITTNSSQQTAWGDIKSRLTNFLTDVQALESDDAFNTKVATTSDSSVASISGTSAADEGTYSLSVSQLATNTKVIGSQVSTDKDTALGISGTLTLNSSDSSTTTATSVDVAISATDSLSNVVDKINAQTNKSGVKASLVDNHLVLTAQTAGAKTLAVSADSDSVLSSLGMSSDATTTTTGKTAKFQLDGVSIERNTNSVSDAIKGVTINLSKISSDAVTLSLTNDTSKATSAVSTLVSQYNSLMGLISDDLDVGDPSSSDNTQGTLVGDSELTRLQSQLSSLMTSSATNGTALNASKLGISITDNDGTVGFDADKFKAQLASDPDAVKNFFYQSTKSITGTTKSESGYAASLGSLANNYLSDTSTNKGTIAVKLAGYTTSTSELNDQIKKLTTALEAKKDHYVDIYTRLDTAMMKAETQLSYVTSLTSSTSSSSSS
ncbi:flagellar filament capping protein FliD [Lactobacillus sp. UCMA15818]|uniref:flagellar filament capping protein FliD n=1 Tax=Lactobacillus sp. UCMA15818 TaxID=2583394 RepID=UPI0025B1A8A0|nr:flagellar filament capping protein FliD [Lactobacillus sp. UCMA15818]MDN2453697.1 flagellar hook protein [Lactobacillus sp. UCMA15818]